MPTGLQKITNLVVHEKFYGPSNLLCTWNILNFSCQLSYCLNIFRYPGQICVVLGYCSVLSQFKLQSFHENLKKKKCTKEQQLHYHDSVWMKLSYEKLFSFKYLMKKIALKNKQYIMLNEICKGINSFF